MLTSLGTVVPKEASANHVLSGGFAAFEGAVMADTVDEKLKTIAERHVRALAEDMPLQAQLLILDADALLDAKLAAHAVVQ